MRLHPRPSKKLSQSQKMVYRLLGIQLIWVFIISLLWLFQSREAVVSTWIGGSICIVAQALFAQFFLIRFYGQQPRNIIQAFYIGEFIKLILSVALLFFVLQQLHMALLPLLSGFLTAHFSFWLASMMPDNLLRALMQKQ